MLDILQRDLNPEPWAEHDKIPWDDPDFSRRMLAEHLSQEHDAASRRAEIIDQHVGWIHRDVLNERPSRILDLGCGPGLYTSRLARLGHSCTGVDFGPASIEYACDEADREDLACRYIQADIRQAEFGTGFDLVMLIFGEFNVFRPSNAREILRRAHHALAPEGRLLLEVHIFEPVRAAGLQPPRWRSADAGLFSERPHLRLDEAFWDERRQVAIERYYVIDAATSEVSRFGASTQAYDDESYEQMTVAAGFEHWEWLPGWPGLDEGEDFRLLLAWGG